MADQADVEAALTAIVAGVLYPSGAEAPSILGVGCRVYRGWPSGAPLDADLAAGRINVTVFPEPRPHVTTTRLAAEERIIDTTAPTLSITVKGVRATVAGAALAGQVAGLQVDDMAVVHRTAPGDTPAMVAAVLASYVRTRRIATVAGATLEVPGVGFMLGRVSADRQVRRETRRQRQVFRITVWCPSAELRDRAGAAIDSALAALDFIGLADGTGGRLLYRGSSLMDQSLSARLYRRDLLYSVEYATTVTTTLPAMVFGDVRILPNGAHPGLTLIG